MARNAYTRDLLAEARRKNRLLTWALFVLAFVAMVSCGSQPFVRYAKDQPPCGALTEEFISELEADFDGLFDSVEWIMVQDGDHVAFVCNGKRTCWTGRVIATECNTQEVLRNAILWELVDAKNSGTL